MAPHRESFIGSYSKRSENAHYKPPELSMESLRRSLSDVTFELSKEDIEGKLPTISEVEDARCECCGMSEECTSEYINRVRDRFSGKLICGLCAEAVNEEMEKNGGKREEALNEHMAACVRFNRVERTNPVLYQSEAIKEMLKNSRSRAKSMSPRTDQRKGGLARSSSCIATIAGERSEDD